MKIKHILPFVFAACLIPSLSYADADPAKGEKVFKKCKACHSMEEGKNKVGPSLYGIMDNEAATVEGYKYSDAMLESGIVWTEDIMAEYLKKPKAMIKGTKMAFAGLKKDKDISNLIAFLKETED